MRTSVNPTGNVAPAPGAHAPTAGPARSTPGRLPSASTATMLGLVIVGAVAVTDLLTSNVNLAIVYCLPMAIFARTARPAVIWRIAAALVVLTFVGYLLGPSPEPRASWETFVLRYRMANRTIAAGSIFAIAAMAHFGIVVRRRMDVYLDPENLREADRQLFRDVLGAFDQFFASAMTIGAILLVAIVDFLTPARFNPSIVYAVPVLACVRVHRRVFLWGVVATVIGLIYAGFYLGPQPAAADAELLARSARNRWITSLMVFCIGAFAHLLIGIDAPVRRSARQTRVPTSGGVDAEQ